MKRFHFAVGLMATVACVGLQAQTLMRANIPFEFSVGETHFAPGEYDIRYSSHVLAVHQAAGDHAAAMSLTFQASRPNTPETGLLEFRRYGNSYFLSKIWTPGNREGGALPKTAREKELASRGAPSQTEALVLQTK